MNDIKLKSLFAAARKESPPAATEGFDLLVMQTVRREPAPATSAPTIFDELNVLFPRFAWAAAAVIVVCVAGDFLTDAPSLTDGVAQISQQWLLSGNGF